MPHNLRHPFSNTRRNVAHSKSNFYIVERRDWTRVSKTDSSEKGKKGETESGAEYATLSVRRLLDQGRRRLSAKK